MPANLSKLAEHSSALRAAARGNRPHNPLQYYAIQRSCVEIGRGDGAMLSMVLGAVAALAEGIAKIAGEDDAIEASDLRRWQLIAEEFAAVLDNVVAGDFGATAVNWVECRRLLDPDPSTAH